MRLRFAVIATVAAQRIAVADPASDARSTFEADIKAHVTNIAGQMADPASKPSVSEAAQVVGRVAEHQRPAGRALDNARAATRNQALDPENAATLPRLASLAIKTDIKDTEAGVAIAPLVLAGSTSPLATGLSLTFAALEDDKFRAGISVSVPVGSEEITLDDLALDRCPFDEAKYTDELVKRAVDFGEVCAVLYSSDRPTDPKKLDNWRRGLGTCGFKSAPAANAEDTVAFDAAAKALDAAGKPLHDANKLVARIAAVLSLAKEAQFTEPAMGDRFYALTPRIDRLKKTETAPTPYGCNAEDQDQITSMATKATWRHVANVVGVSATGDFYPIQWGFNPDDSSKLPHGNAAKLDARAEWRRSVRRQTFSLGLGARSERDKPHDDFVTSVRPSLGIQYVITRLDGGDLLDKNGDVNTLKKGQLPPLLVLGIDALVGVVAAGQPSTQDSRLNELSITAFADFRITADLAFRIGIPLKGEIVTRDADPMASPPVTEKKALQWTVPVFLTTVIAL